MPKVNVGSRMGTPPPPSLRATNVRVRNVVGSAHTPHAIHLPRLAKHLHGKCKLDLTMFPAVRCVLQQQQQGQQFTALVFASGRVIVTGCREASQMEKALDQMQHMCTQFPSPQHFI